MSRSPSSPPTLPGFTFIRHIGGGGFADVFLYEDQALARQVAVKVLLASQADDTVRAQFKAESTLMAALSDHPHIVAIYQAAISSDGRPYLMMEYCPGATLSERYKAGAMPVRDVVTMGIQLAGAVETAHRFRILHRDIKPANVLTTRSGRPALTDFGISVAVGAVSDTVGMSIPWSPPEMLAESPDGDHRADVYSLAATLYTLLARRSPYERPGGPNSAIDLATRIQRSPLPPLGRSDVPESLERALSRGLAKNPAGRFTSALQLAHALQDVQDGERWPVTDVDVFDENPDAAKADLGPADDGRTRIRGLTVIPAQAPQDPTSRRSPFESTSRRPPVHARRLQAAPPAVEGTLRRGATPVPNYLQMEQLAAPQPADTMVRSPVPQPAGEAVTAVQARRPRWPWLAAGAAALAILVTAGIVVLTRGTAPAGLSDNPDQSGSTGQAVDVGVPSPTDLKATEDGDSWVFTWRNPDPQPGDSYQWERTDTDSDKNAQSVGQPPVRVQANSACISVILVRDNGRFSEPAPKCTADR